MRIHTTHTHLQTHLTPRNIDLRSLSTFTELVLKSAKLASFTSRAEPPIWTTFLCRLVSSSLSFPLSFFPTSVLLLNVAWTPSDLSECCTAARQHLVESTSGPAVRFQMCCLKVVGFLLTHSELITCFSPLAFSRPPFFSPKFPQRKGPEKNV